MKTKKKLLLFVILILIAGLYSVNYFRHAQTILRQEISHFIFPELKDYPLYSQDQSILRLLIVMAAV